MPADRLSGIIAAALLVTSFTVVGWVALWAAHSRASWFARTVIVLLFLAPLLAVPAYDAFVAFALQSVLIAAAIQFGRWYTNRQRMKAAETTAAEVPASRASSVRFSIMWLLQITVIVAVATWIALRSPKLNSVAWINVGQITGTAALASMAGALLSLSKKPIIWLVAIGGCTLLGAQQAWSDWFLPSLTSDLSDWPPDPTPVVAPVGLGAVHRPIVAWFFIPASIALLTALFVSRQIRAFVATDSASSPAPVPHRDRWRTRVALATFALFVAAFPLYVLGNLLTLAPIPLSTTPNPNGHDDLIAAGKIAASSNFDDESKFNFSTSPQQALAAEVAKCSAAYDLITRGVARDCQAPVNYSDQAGMLPMEDIRAARVTARALAGKARLAELENRTDDAARIHVEAIQFGNQLRRGGLLVDALVGIACSEYGKEPLYKNRSKFSPQVLDRCIDVLTHLDASDEPYADVWQRDYVWTQRAYGWQNHLRQLLDELSSQSTVNPFFADARGYEYVYWSNQATLRLLICELALARYHQDYGHWPATLDELVPKYLQRVPTDPLSPNGDALKYHPANDAYVLYSLGSNCVDDNGAIPASDDSPRDPTTGDLRLDWVYGPHTQPTAPSANPPGDDDPGEPEPDANP
jgi:hypothetical protein